MEGLVTNNDKIYLQDLAKKYKNYSALEIMHTRTNSWYTHNELKSEKPLIVMEMITFERDFLPKLKCETELGCYIEKILLSEILNYELINDDKVIPPYFPIDLHIDYKAFGLGIENTYAKDTKNWSIGYKSKHLISNLKEDLPQIAHSTYSVNKELTYSLKNSIEEVIGGILPVVIKNTSLNWHMMPTKYIVDLMGMEAMMYAMFDYPEQIHQLLDFLKEDIVQYIEWQQKENLLTLNNGNDYAGSGSYGFTSELPQPGQRTDVQIQPKDLWGNMNSQESVGISPEMYGEFIYPYYHDLAEHFGFVYYGCCEPVHDVWEKYLSNLPNLRKISISPWCDEQKMGEYLQNETVIYSRKPSPNYIGVGKELDEDNFKAHITETLKAAKGTTLEIVFRDIYTLEGNVNKPGRAVEIVRELIDKKW